MPTNQTPTDHTASPSAVSLAERPSGDSTIESTKVVPVDDLSNRRRTSIITVCFAVIFVAAIIVTASFYTELAEKPDLLAKNQTPSLAHPFGTDWLGRDMFARTIVGLRLSLLIGMAAAAFSAAIALTFGTLAGVFGGWVDRFVTTMVDLFMSLPHLVLLILVAFAAGGGVTGVIVAVSTTHWPTLTRVLRGESHRVASADYVLMSRTFGHSRLWVARHHVLGQLISHFMVGMALLFPHAILHEAALSFLGLGLEPHSPAIGILLSDSMTYLSTGAWWLAAMPGLALLVVVKVIDILGEHLRLLTDPRSVHE